MALKLGLLSIVVMLLLMSALPSGAWDDEGHMAVAYIAYKNLRPEVRRRANALVKLNPYYATWLRKIPAGASAADRQEMIFMFAATWSDAIKGDKNYTDDGTEGGNRPDGETSSKNIGYSDLLRHRYWHFIDEPFTQDGTALNGPETPNAATQIAVFRKVVSSSASDPLKSYDMVWLLHLIGDVHQPLHCTSRFSRDMPSGDEGGNLVKLNPDPSHDKLHAFWDDVLGTATNPASAIDVASKLAGPKAGLASDTDSQHWISESVQDSKDDVYISPIGAGAGPFTITKTYRSRALALAKKRVGLAGARLASVLNGELK